MTEAQGEEQFMNRGRFTQVVEDYVVSLNLSYMDAVIEACDSHNIDPQDVKKFIGPNVKKKIEAEAMNLNFLPRQNQLIFE